jgi:hypothetical protein
MSTHCRSFFTLVQKGVLNEVLLSGFHQGQKQYASHKIQVYACNLYFLKIVDRKLSECGRPCMELRGCAFKFYLHWTYRRNKFSE